MPEVVVFLGPSLRLDEALRIMEAKAGIVDIRPPAKRGDLIRAAKEGARVICLIDGVFFQECAVAHKEVIYALDMGARVLGASSMGALRASELDVYGMEGVGKIYDAYRRGEIESDDEVALIFDPMSFEPLSEPLVNIRFNIDLALEAGAIDKRTRDALIAAARSLYFPERTYDKIIADCAGEVDDEALRKFREFLDEKRRDLKGEDAAKALLRAREIMDEN